MAIGCASCLTLTGMPTSDQMEGWAVESQDRALNGLGISPEEFQKILQTARQEGVKIAQDVQTMQGKQPVVTPQQAAVEPLYISGRPGMDWTQALMWVAGGAAAVGIGMFLFKKMSKGRGVSMNPRKRTRKSK